MQGYFVGRIPDDHWRALFTYYLAEADSFLVHMPDGEGFLSYGWQEFRSLPGISIRPWDGMKDAIEIVGELSPHSRQLFTSIETSIDGYESGKKLWDYRLLRGGHVALSIGDFSDLLIWPTEADRAQLTSLGITADDWQPL
jgi:hypothetical protein